jgi:hypothetical protein
MLYSNGPEQTSRFAVVVPVGPGGDEQERLTDLVDSVFHFEPATAGLIIIDDGAGAKAASVPVPPSCKLVRVVNPRQGRHNPVSGGLCAGMLAGFERCLEVFSDTIAFVVKLDTDALVIAPFAERLTRLFASNPEVGMAGAYRHTPNGEDRDFGPWTELVTDLTHRWIPTQRRWRRAGRRMPLAVSGQALRRRTIFREAFARGYIAGHHCLGGAYGITQSTLRTIAEAGYLRDPLLWLDTSIGEDVLISCLTQAVGKQLVDYCRNNEVFGIRYRGLVDTPDKLLERGFSILHSTKSDPRVSERELREYFRIRRHPLKSEAV